MKAPTELLESGDELDTVGRALDAVRGGTGGLLMVEGEAGAGKTSLLANGQQARGRTRDARPGPAAASTSKTSPTASPVSSSSRFWPTRLAAVNFCRG